MYGACVTNNRGFWIWWLDLLALPYNYRYTLNSFSTTSGWWISHVVWLSDWSLVSRILDLELYSPWTESESYVTTDGESASLSWNKAPIWGLRPDFYYCQTFVGLLTWGALSDERTDLSFTIAAGPRQYSHYRIRVPWDSRPYFTVSDSKLPFSSPPTARRDTVEVFDPASTRDPFEFTNPLPFITATRP
jgi:hypothetical protein